MNEEELSKIADLVLSAEPGKNVVYYSGTQGWSKIPLPLRRMISSMVSEGLIVSVIKRDGKGTFAMVSQRTKKPLPKLRF